MDLRTAEKIAALIHRRNLIVEIRQDPKRFYDDPDAQALIDELISAGSDKLLEAYCWDMERLGVKP